MDGRKEIDILDALVNFILGSASNPVEMAVYFLMFVILIDSIFGIVITLVNGARR